MLLFLLLVVNVKVYEPPYVDIPPRCTLYVNPYYPSISGDSGLVVLRVLVDDQGDPVDWEVWFSTDSVFVEPSVESIRFFKFAPALIGKRRVPCWTLVTIPFIKGESLPLMSCLKRFDRDSLEPIVVKVNRDGSKLFFQREWKKIAVAEDFKEKLEFDNREGFFLLKIPRKWIKQQRGDSSFR